jgi:hypothetical protein
MACDSCSSTSNGEPILRGLPCFWEETCENRRHQLLISPLPTVLWPNLILAVRQAASSPLRDRQRLVLRNTLNCTATGGREPNPGCRRFARRRSIIWLPSMAVRSRYYDSIHHGGKDGAHQTRQTGYPLSVPRIAPPGRAHSDAHCPFPQEQLSARGSHATLSLPLPEIPEFAHCDSDSPWYWVASHTG